jgi:hypothetical protein
VRALATSVALLLSLSSSAQADGRSFLIVVSGIGGEAVYSETFANWARTLITAAETRMGMPREHIVYLAETETDGANAISHKSAVNAAIDRVGASAEAGDTIFLVLIGHGTARDHRFLFNLPGPDLSAMELDTMLEPHSDVRWVVVNGAPSSGPFIRALSAPKRVVVTATASAAERYHTVFLEYFIAAYAKPGADSDKNGRVSLREAFDFAKREVARSYTEEARLQSEHAILDDAGALAPVSYLENARRQYADTIPEQELQRLLTDRARVEGQLTSLIATKTLYDPRVYDDRLETLLVDFALIHRALRPPEALR